MPIKPNAYGIEFGIIQDEPLVLPLKEDVVDITVALAMKAKLARLSDDGMDST
jgi:hypothetical protein